MKKKIIGLVIVLLLIIMLCSYLIYSFSVNKKENDNKTSVNEVLEVVSLFEKMGIEEYIVDDFVLSGVNLSLNDGNDSVEVNLISNEDSYNIILELSLYDKNGKLLEIVSFTVDSLLEGEERTLFCYVDFELEKIESFSAKIKND